MHAVQGVLAGHANRLFHAWCVLCALCGVHRELRGRTRSMATVEERSTSKAANDGDAARDAADDGAHAQAGRRDCIQVEE